MKQALDMRHLAALVALDEHGGISRAALALGLAQSTLSETLLSLERVLGCAVTERRPGSRATLSPPALRLLPHARAILQARDRALDAARGENGPVRVGTVESVSACLLPAALAAGRALDPGLEVEVTVGLCEGLKALFAEGALDLALTLEAADAPDSGGLPETAVPLVLVRRPARPDEPPPATLLVPDPEGALHATARDWLRRRRSSLRLASAGSIAGLRSGVLAGGSLGLLPDYTVREDLARGVLQVVPGEEPPAPLALRIRRHDAHAPERRAAIDGLLDRIAGQLADTAAMTTGRGQDATCG